MKYNPPDTILGRVVRLFRKWGVKESEWSLATEGALQRAGYKVYDQKNPYEVDVLVRRSALPWKITKTHWTEWPPSGSSWFRDLEHFVKETKYSIHILAIPFTSFSERIFRKSFRATLKSGEKIQCVTPESYVLQVMGLLTHKETAKMFVDRIPKWMPRLNKIYITATQLGDQKTIRACEMFFQFANGRSKHLKVQKKLPGKRIRELTGNVAGKNKSIVKGTVQIILHSSKFNKFRSGRILVTTDTNPEFIRIIRKVKALITDTGGISSHAAILAREFNLPTVIGTKIATKVLKDGDLVEVDADKGVVRKL